MIGLLYLIIAVFWGSALCGRLFPGLGGLTKISFSGKQLKISSLFLLVPAWVYLGVLPMTWFVYFASYLLRNAAHGMRIANAAAMLLFLTGGLVLYLCGKKNRLTAEKPGLRLSRGELVFLLLVLYLSVRLFWTTFRIEGNQLYVGLSVFSDFSPHLGMIRSFSSGNNFPTTYSHFAGQDIKYHFMFQFLVGNLEFLGMRLDYAFNVPSLIGFVSTFSLLYVLAARLTARKSAGFVACLLFAFRSSPSVFRYLGGLPAGTNLWKALFEHSSFVGYTTHEDWGLWNLNVYCNQRHLAFTLGVLLFVLMLFLPHLYAAAGRLRAEWRSSRGHISFFFQRSLFCAEGWSIGGKKGVTRAVCAGLLLGALAFWNGAVTIAALLVLFVLAAVSDRRLEFLITAVLAVLLSVLQSAFFIDGSAVTAELLFGFIAENRTVFGVIDYVFRLTGFVLFVVAGVFVAANAEGRCATAAFAAPFAFSFFVSLTPDVTVNHKYIMISLMLLGIPAALGIARLWDRKKASARAVAVLLTVLLTATGVFEYAIVLNRNAAQNNLKFDVNDELTAWIRENADAQDIFLTSNYALNNVVLGGAMLFNGWQYFSWSAGYDTELRAWLVQQMYEAESPEELRQLTEENHIRYIIVDHDNRTSGNYTVREDVIERTFLAVYSQGEGDWRTTIYDVSMPVK